MTQSEKDLLLKDLCSRLPYKVKVQDTYYKSLEPAAIWLLDLHAQKVRMFADEGYQSIEYIKPYLFPISSITEEQWKEITDIQIKESLKSIDSNNDYMSNPLFSIGDLKTLDWCYANHIDYRGLIPMGLAIDATGLNIY